MGHWPGIEKACCTCKTGRKRGLRMLTAFCGCCCRLQNVFIIGKDDKPLISLPKGKGVRLDILQEQAKRDAAKA